MACRQHLIPDVDLDSAMQPRCKSMDPDLNPGSGSNQIEILDRGLCDPDLEAQMPRESIGQSMGYV